MASLVELRRGADEFISALEQRVREIDQREHDIQRLHEDAMRERELVARQREELEHERQRLDDEKRQMSATCVRPSDIITLNIGGEKCVQRRRSTLCAAEDSFLSARFSGRWEQELDRDKEGRYFINFSPEIFMPLLDYLGMKEIEDPLQPTPFPRGPESTQVQFASMLSFYGIAAEPPALGRSLLSLSQTKYAAIRNGCRDFAFELRVKQQPVSVTALEVASASMQSHECSVTMFEGPLDTGLKDLWAWSPVGGGVIHFQAGSWVQFTHPVRLAAETTHCIMITGLVGVEHWFFDKPQISAEDDFVQVLLGRACNDLFPSQLVGKLEYNILNS